MKLSLQHDSTAPISTVVDDTKNARDGDEAKAALAAIAELKGTHPDNLMAKHFDVAYFNTLSGDEQASRDVIWLCPRVVGGRHEDQHAGGRHGAQGGGRAGVISSLRDGCDNVFYGIEE